MWKQLWVWICEWYVHACICLLACTIVDILIHIWLCLVDVCLSVSSHQLISSCMQNPYSIPHHTGNVHLTKVNFPFHSKIVLDPWERRCRGQFHWAKFYFKDRIRIQLLSQHRTRESKPSDMISLTGPNCRQNLERLEEWAQQMGDSPGLWVQGPHRVMPAGGTLFWDGNWKLHSLKKLAWQSRRFETFVPQKTK